MAKPVVVPPDQMILDRAREKYQAAKREQDTRDAAAKKAELERRKEAALRGLDAVFPGTRARSLATDGGAGRVVFGSLKFALVDPERPDSTAIGIYYACDFCKKTHVFPTSTEYDVGEFLEKKRVSTPCPSRTRKSETAETRLLSALREYMREQQAEAEPSWSTVLDLIHAVSGGSAVG
jgi:hypothetical protein